MSSKKTWYVQTGFGTVLGPMPTDVLREMVRTGEMVRSDQVRKGSGGRWHPASEIPGLFDPITSADSEQESTAPPIANPTSATDTATQSSEPEPSSTEQSVSDSISRQPESPATEQSASAPTVTAESEPSSAAPSVKSRLIPPSMPVISAIATSPPVAAEPSVAAESIESLKAKPLADLPAEPPSDDVSKTQPPPREDDLISRWREERDRTRDELGAVSLAAEMTQSEEVENFAPELPVDLRDEESEMPATKLVSPISESTTRRRTIERPAFLDQVAGLEDGPRVQAESPKQKWDRWRRSLPDLRIAAAVIVVLFAAWWFWPRSSRGIYDRYVAIWDEWKIRRVDPKDPAGWEQFLNRTEKELNATVSYLEKHAGASDRESQLLLFIGRDCLQKMLRAPKQIGSPLENQMQILFTVLQEMYEPSSDGKRIETVVKSTRTKPKVRERNQAIEGEADPRRSRPLREEQRPPGTPKPTAAPVEPNPAQP
jgi:hypothetical protein